MLTTYALDVYAARKLNMQPKANAGGIHNLVVTSGDKSLEMFKNIVAVANDVDVRGNIRTPSVLISQMMIGGE
ncbi:MAG: hypothetical protein EXR81_02840 [Gammaproteobacteria bacterium]|nr:hypothetical protein [Gammaproteobacteria bacterium]